MLRHFTFFFLHIFFLNYFFVMSDNLIFHIIYNQKKDSRSNPLRKELY